MVLVSAHMWVGLYVNHYGLWGALDDEMNSVVDFGGALNEDMNSVVDFGGTLDDGMNSVVDFGGALDEGNSVVDFGVLWMKA